MNHKGLNQLLCAATVNSRFREALLRAPAQAIATGYLGQAFSLTSEERILLTGIQAQRLEEYAAKVYCWISTNDDRGRPQAVVAPATAELPQPC